MRGQIRETIGRRKMEEEWDRFLREMRSEAYVDIRSETVIGAQPADVFRQVINQELDQAGIVR